LIAFAPLVTSARSMLSAKALLHGLELEGSAAPGHHVVIGGL
jgi:hypothetical protein